MRLGKNLLAGLANSIWSVVVSVLALPFYIRYLGLETYGLIGFFVTLQAVFHLLDMGMTPAINREVARCSALGKLSESGRLLHTLAIIYWGVAGLIGILVLLSGSWIAEHWLQSKQLLPQTIANAVMLMGLVVVFRFPIGLYQGALIGAQRLTISSAISMVMVTTANLGAVAILAYVSPTIEAFFIWQACVALVFAMTMRFAAWRIIGRPKRIGFDVEKLKSVWRFTAGMSGVAVSGMLLMQLDKIMLSKILSLDDFGRYTLAAVMATFLRVFLAPLFNTIYPRMSALVAATKTEELIELYRSGTLLFLAFFLPIAISISVFSEDVLYLWTRDQSLATSSALIASLFLIGIALNGVMHFPYALQLAYGETWLPLTINIILIIIMVPLIIFLARSYGAVGGAAAWVLTNVLYVLLGGWLTHRVLLKGIWAKWLFGDVLRPLAMSLLVVGGGGLLIQTYDFPHYVNILLGVGLVGLTFMFMLLVSSKLRIVTMNLRNDASILN